MFPYKVKGKTMRSATTSQLLALNEWAIQHNMNRYMTQTSQLDPDGVHLCIFTMEHTRSPNDPKHLRTMWMVKYKGSPQPNRIFLDVAPLVLKSNSESLPESAQSKGGTQWKLM